MPTPSEIKTALQIAEENKEIIAISVYNQLQGIAKQDVWRKRDRTLIYTADLDLDTIDQTILDIIAGNHALICIEKESGVDPAEANLFHLYVLHTLTLIIGKLTEHDRHQDRHHTDRNKRTDRKSTDRKKCAALRKTIQTDLHGYWIDLYPDR